MFAVVREFGSAILDVVRADVYIEHRIWHFSNNIAGTYGVVNNLAELERALPGALHPDNPLKYGIYKALQNSGETPVIYAAVKEPNRLESWQDAFRDNT